MTFEVSHYAQASLDCAGALKSMSVVATSASVGWSCCLLDHMEGDDASDLHETHTTPDVRIIVATRGLHDVDVLRDGRWRSWINQAGTVALTPGGENARVKRRNRVAGSPYRQAFLHVPSAFFFQAAELVHRPGRPLSANLPRIFATEESVAACVVGSLLKAMGAGAPDIYAETAVRWLALHLVSRFGDSPIADESSSKPIALTDTRFTRAVEFMTANLARPVSIAEVAREAGVSAFHFTRLFTRRMGLPPHAFLTRCRMEKAHLLLSTTDLAISVLAAECGYPIASSFSSAFFRHFGHAPTAVHRPSSGAEFAVRKTGGSHAE